MKHLWRLLTLGGALAFVGCADSPSAPATASLALADVPTTIVVPRIRGSEAGTFEFDAERIRRIVESDDPHTGENCFDVCDGDGGSNDPGGGDVPDDGIPTPTILAAYTEAHFERDIFKGHAEMTYQFADHASQEMTLMTARMDGSTLGSMKFSSGKIWPLPQLVAQGLITDGSIFGPQCDGRGTAISQHGISITVATRTYGVSGPSQSPMMYQAKCQPVSESGGQTRTETAGYTPTGGLRICYRLDHYSSLGEYIYTETLYCYDTYNAT